MHLRALGHDVQLIAFGPGADEAALELEDAQKVDEVALDEPQAAQVGQLVFAEAQRAQVVQRGIHFGQQLGQRVQGLVAADKAVFALRLWMPVQQRLPHGELVQVGVEQAGDDGGHDCS